MVRALRQSDMYAPMERVQNTFMAHDMAQFIMFMGYIKDKASCHKCYHCTLSMTGIIYTT